MIKKLFLIATYLIAMGQPVIAMNSNQVQHLALIALPNTPLFSFDENSKSLRTMVNGLATGYYLAQQKQLAAKHELYKPIISSFEKLPIDMRNEIAHLLVYDTKTKDALIQEFKERKTRIGDANNDLIRCAIGATNDHLKGARGPNNSIIKINDNNYLKHIFYHKIKWFSIAFIDYLSCLYVPDTSNHEIWCNVSWNKKFLTYLEAERKETTGSTVYKPINLYIRDINNKFTRMVKNISLPSLKGWDAHSIKAPIKGIAIDDFGKQVAVAYESDIAIIDVEKDIVTRVIKNISNTYHDPSKTLLIGFDELGTCLTYGTKLNNFESVQLSSSVQLPSFDATKDYLKQYLKDNKLCDYYSVEEKIASGWLD